MQQQMSKVRASAVGALVAGVLLLVSGAVPAEAKGRAGASVEGRLSSLSLSAKTLTVQSARGQTMLKVDDGSRLVRNGRRAALADFVLGDRIAAQFDRATLRLKGAQARGPELQTTRGRLAQWDAAAHLLDVRTARGERTFRVESATRITRNGQAARPADLRVGDALTVHSGAGQSPLAGDVQAEGDDEAEVEGEITAISGNDVTIDPEPGDPVTVHVDDDTVIRLSDHGEKTDATLADLEAGQEAEAEYDPTTLVAFKIHVEAEDEEDEEDEEQSEVEGVLAAVDAAAGTFAITPEHGGADVALHIDGETRITLDGEPATLADLTPGAEAEAKYDADSGLASKLKVKTADEADDDDDDEDDDDEDEDDEDDDDEDDGEDD